MAIAELLTDLVRGGHLRHTGMCLGRIGETFGRTGDCLCGLEGRLSRLRAAITNTEPSQPNTRTDADVEDDLRALREEASGE